MNAANDPLGDGVLDVDYRIVCPDGSERWLHVQGQSEFIGEGADRHPSLASGAVIDITERKKMEMEIKSQNELLESVIENIPDPFGVYDKTGSLLQMNAAGRKLYKHDTGINVQVIHAEFVCFDLQGNKIPHENLPTRRALRGETVRNDVFVIKRPESERIIECNATPIFDNNKNIVTVIVGHRDITELKNREQNEFIHKQKEQLHQIELQKEKNIALEKVIEMKDEFLSIISHEFKTPLAVINSSLQLIEMMCKDSLSDRAKRYLDYIGENSNRLLKLVNNLLDITRANAGHLKINQSNLDIVLLTKSITESIATYAIQKSIMLSFSSTLSQKVIGIDEEKYERILLNLLSNAIKFTPTGKSINVQISQSIFKGKCKICIQVKDQGIGIPDDKKDLIFERFGQVNSSLTRQAEGTGIGLSLVKILVELQGGEIMLESKEGMGSTFTVLLPVTKVDESTMEPMLIDLADNRLIQATAIEFSDVFM